MKPTDKKCFGTVEFSEHNSICSSCRINVECKKVCSKKIFVVEKGRFKHRKNLNRV